MKKVRGTAKHLLLILFMITASLSGCSSGSTPTGSSNTATEANGSNGMASSDASAERETITLAIAQNSNVENYDTNYLTTMIENEFNVDIEFIHLPSDVNDAKTKFALMVSSGETLPDIIVNDSFTNLDIADYGQKGTFIALNDYLEDAKYFNAIESQEDKDLIIQSTTSPDGNIYSLAKYYPEIWNATPYRFWINQTWLDNLGLSTPETTDDFYKVMKAFATDDPNGNVIHDEIAITGSTLGWGTNPVYYIMNSFVFCYDNDLALSENGETVIAPFATDEWFAGIEYMNMLCKEGLLSPSIFTQDATQLTATLSNETQIVGGTAAGGTGYWSESTDNPNFQDMIMLAPLTGPDGVSYAAYSQLTPTPTLYITKDCDNPDLAFAISDYFFKSDVSITGRYGEENVDWSTDSDITAEYTGLYEESLGIPCSMVQLNIVWSAVQNKHWYNVAPGYVGLDHSMGMDDGSHLDEAGAVNYAAITKSMSYEYYYNAHPEYVLPTMIYTTEEADQLAEIQENIKSYVKESLAEFITGNRPLSEWDNYLENLDNMGLATYLKIGQTAYERMSEK